MPSDSIAPSDFSDAVPEPSAGAITDVDGIEVGHFSDSRRPTGCTVILAQGGAVAGVDVRGGGPGTRETDLLASGNFVQQVHGIVLAGGSAWGLAAADGAVRWLEEQGVGLDVRYGTLPIVPAAVLFDLPLGDARIRPDAAAGYAACQAASRLAPAEGNVGAGSGALVGKLFGVHRAMKGGIGTASIEVDGFRMGALIACNALGDVLDPGTGRVVAGARTEDGRALLDTRRALLRGELPKPILAASNTTIGVIATDATLTKAQANRLATVAHDGLARAINPVHTMSDGDTLFALATGAVPATRKSPDMIVLCTMAAEVVARATLRAVQAAQSVRLDAAFYPCVGDLGKV
ncbi:putative enzyme [Burkholderiales bacterium 8X]|nr:putative enzyme [Burkholderiales bacterium 8X]